MKCCCVVKTIRQELRRIHGKIIRINLMKEEAVKQGMRKRMGCGQAERQR